MPTTLAAGDIAFTRIQTTQPASASADIFAFVTLVDLAANTQIYFTDNGWLAAGAFRTGEGTIRWDSGTGTITAGTVITLAGPLVGTSGNWRGDGGASNGATGLDSASVGSWTSLNVGGTAAIAGGNGLDLSNSGDSLIAYQATDPNAPTTLLAAINNRAFSATNSSNDSAVPGTGTATTADDLPLGQSSVQITGGAAAQVYGAYGGPTAGTADELRIALNTTSNWTASGTFVSAGPASFTVTGGNSATVAVDDVSIAEGNGGTTLLTFTVTRTSNVGAFTVGYATADATATAGEDYDAAAGTLAFTAGGDISQTVTVTVSGDLAFEGDETLTLTLSDLVSTSGTNTIADATGVGTIVNDDASPSDLISIDDVSIAEGNDGTTLLTFTVSREGNGADFNVTYATADGTATAGGDYAATTGTVSFAAGGALTQTFTVAIVGDTVFEPSETFAVELSGLEVTGGSAVLDDAQGVGTIVNDDIALTAIYTLQGVGHRAPTIGGGVADPSVTGTARYNVEGVVTGIAQNGFYFQDATGDDNDLTSDGLFVFTGTNAAVLSTLTIGNTVRVLNAPLAEFRAGTNNLSVTQLTGNASGASVQNLGGNTTVDAVVLGVERFIPTGQVSDPGFATYDVTTDAADFWESLEGMLVEIPTSIATSPTVAFRSRDPFNSTLEGPPNEELWVRVPANTAPGSQTAEGGLLLGQFDVNPERIQLDDIRTSIDFAEIDVGATIAPIQGVVNYDFVNYEVLVSTAPIETVASPIVKETTAIVDTFRTLTIGGYNVENLDPEIEDSSFQGTGGVSGSDQYTRDGNRDDDIGSGKYAMHARQIAVNMGAPTIVALQEVQDNDGAEISSVVDSAETLQVLVDAIYASYGIRYAFAYENPPTSNVDGGQPNANIRPAFLYRADEVTLIDTIRLTDPNPAATDGFAGDDFTSSRKPLVGIFEYNGVALTIINNHFNSKGGDNGIYGNVQPPVLSSELQRIEQAKIVNDYVDALLAADPNAKVMVVGDLNDFAWSNPLQALQGVGDDRILFDLAEALLPANERYSYNFEGNAQVLDHTLVNGILLDQADVAFDIVHVNSEFADQVSDHDPSVTRLDFTAFGERLRLTAAGESIEGGAGDDRILARAGSDTIAGGADDDRLSGGSGLDVFVFGPNEGDDRIVDFAIGADRIDLTAYAALGIDAFEDLVIRGTTTTTIRLPAGAGEAASIRLLGVSPDDLTAADFIFA